MRLTFTSHLCFDILVSPLFTRFSRKADSVGFILCWFEDAVWDLAASSCL
jgi:hypothetical protein